MRVAIVNYGMGNIYSITSALRFHSIETIDYTAELDDLLQADRIVLPGVGSYKEAMRHIKEHGLKEKLECAVLKHKIPILGICLGMQLLGNSSTEDGFTEGLGLFNGKVERFDIDPSLKIPHVGFNSVIHNTSKLYQKIPTNADFYFTHSYRMLADNSDDINFGYCNYGMKFVASFEQNHIFGTQFHPEKSQSNGLKLLENFLFNI